ncbi:MAG TPA: hypothetical protein VN258_20630 [Mobilitalea sp.]|nr:hypothetical protein [Mobilitalea sp.]
MIDMEAYTTKYGKLKGIGLYTIHDNGILKDCTFDEKVDLHTPYGILTPQYTYDYRKKNNYALSFYSDGTLRRISLEQATDLLTPIGPLSAELLTFYDNGSIKRLFPLNGQISAYWEEKDEYQLAKETSFHFAFGRMNAKIIAISFYEDGNVKDLTFWPKQKIKVQTPIGSVQVRIGLSLYPDGSLRSVEPAYPTKISTPIGALLAYDKNASGISGDRNSLCFTPDGKLSSVATSGNRITVIGEDNHTVTHSPVQEADEDGVELSFQPMVVEFEQDYAVFNHTTRYPVSTYKFNIEPYRVTAVNLCDDCESCGKQCSRF